MAKKFKEILKKSMKILVGLILVVVGVLSYLWWWPDLLTLIKGSLGAFVALFGLMLIFLAWSD